MVQVQWWGTLLYGVIFFFVVSDFHFLGFVGYSAGREVKPEVKLHLLHAPGSKVEVGNPREASHLNLQFQTPSCSQHVLEFLQISQKISIPIISP